MASRDNRLSLYFLAERSADDTEYFTANIYITFIVQLFSYDEICQRVLKFLRTSSFHDPYLIRLWRYTVFCI
jgi:hypothetical protein